MDDKKCNFKFDQYEDDRTLYIFTAILFVVGMGLFLLAMFIIAWACDFFGWCQPALSEGWF
jgi:hypothetical protein